MIAERLSARHLVLQYSLATRCMYVSHALECYYYCGNSHYIIDTTSTMYICTYYVHVRARAINPRVVLPWNIERSWLGFENEGREMAEKHTVSRPEFISKHQELVRHVSDSRSTMINYRYLP